MSTLNPTALNKVKRTKSKFPPVVYVYTTTPFFLLYFTPFFLLYFTLLLFFSLAFSLSHVPQIFQEKAAKQKKKHVYISVILPQVLLLFSCIPAHSSIPLSNKHKPTYSKQICIYDLKS